MPLRGPNEVDNTFGPQVVFSKVPPEGQRNLPPSDGLQFFGQVDIDGESEAMTVTLKDIAEQEDPPGLGETGFADRTQEPVEALDPGDRALRLPVLRDVEGSGVVVVHVCAF